MARIRPARTYRSIFSQSWSRYSQKKPRKNYVRAMPHTSLLVFNMGADNKAYDVQFTMNVQGRIQLRSNALEAARQIANKYLEKTIPGGYYFKVLVYPHSVIREHKMATGAGADRISQGMSHAFGKPVSVAARLTKNQPVFMIRTSRQNAKHVKEAFRRAGSKLSGNYKVIAADRNN
ncbi:MAG: 50S ribosomal protein L16 [Candidatus Marsarchaeota archaeon]|nr:50S ribosomal protein L16 [Candidatus Marsarchaeota archaeon]